jgi:5-methylcytosine-specific restriction protein A
MFRPGNEIKRSTIHDRYGGSRQSGISPCAEHPYIFIFSGESGEQYGYHDEWLNDSVFHYTGEGKLGDMSFARGNLALRDHLLNGKRVFLFKSAKTRSYLEFQAEVQLFDVDYFQGIDESGELRIAIKFFFSRVGEQVAYVNQNSYQSIIADRPTDIRVPNITERAGLVTSRVGQGAYRKGIMHRWENRCAVTGYNYSKVLIASHIVPWRESTDKERMDVNNGILLSPTYDALFDKHLISFGDDGEILLSDQLKLTQHSKLGITGDESIVGLRDQNLEYMERHRHDAGI